MPLHPSGHSPDRWRGHGNPPSYKKLLLLRDGAGGGTETTAEVEVSIA